ncbi:hypothetical protein M1L60_11735 [Actinoplanes sp. TRM 88003]|uniref:Uncharacterized protein n=1 Tax=Paractinoplanes aksuensis TaxID=2939490 RepID=A0ABT1DK93_9ACTN|nr:hypothetical protein [Actinoplanes aksuensis]MCO8271264.1 hypothetical protein [Actinoplanes aksuensis]
MGAVDRAARAAVRAAARRWPEDLAPVMRDEWLAELAAISGARRKLAFAGSLAVSPAVDEPSWRERAVVVGRLSALAAGVTLLAAVATNLARGSAALAPVLLLLGVAGLALIGRRVRGSAPRSPSASIAGVAVALFAFLFAGNPVPMMPFMGAADIAPAVATWGIGVALALRWAAATGRRWIAVAGGVVALDLATIAGSAHAATVLGVPAWTAPAWFPLALLPGDIVAFGPHFSDGTAVLGGLQASGPAFHASEILLANAAVSAGPMLLCTAFLIAATLPRPNNTKPLTLEPTSSTPLSHQPTDASALIHRLSGSVLWVHEASDVTPPAQEPIGSSPLGRGPSGAVAVAMRRAGARLEKLGPGGRRAAAGMVAALGALAVAPVLPAAGGDADAVLGKLLDNSTAFGFGFVEHPVGLGAVALLAAVLAMRATDARTTA